MMLKDNQYLCSKTVIPYLCKKKSMTSVNEINSYIQPLKSSLVKHALYQKIKTLEDLQVFLQGHVYAVWDFMSLLKALQSKLTCTTSPWFASPNPDVRYLINEIVLAEESDLTLDGKRLSHFEMYVDAMKKSHTSTDTLEKFLETVQTSDIFSAINASGLHPKVKEFLTFTFKVIHNGKPHEIASAFTFGREDLIPGMFNEMLTEFKTQFKEADLSELVYYFERHIELDADEHGPMAFEMIASLCGDDAVKWREVAETAVVSLEKRIMLWDAIEELIDQQNRT